MHDDETDRERDRKNEFHIISNQKKKTITQKANNQPIDFKKFTFPFKKKKKTKKKLVILRNSIKKKI